MARKKSSKKSNVFSIMSEPEHRGPGLNSRMEIASGIRVRSVRINGNYLLLNSCEVHRKQDIDVKWYIQGGQRASISDIGKKWFEGQITFPLLVDRNGSLLTPIRQLFEASQDPNINISLDTNHLLSHIALTAEDGGSDNNKLLTLDNLAIRNLTVSVSTDRQVEVICDFYGTIESRTDSDYITPENIPSYRAITWADCDASRLSSQMRTISKMEFKIENTIKDFIFLTTVDDPRQDQINFYGIEKTRIEASYEEFLRLGMETENYFHGGWKKDENIIFDFGAIKFLSRVPLFQVSEQPFSSKFLIRKSKFISLTSPVHTNPQGKIIYFAEEVI